MSAASQGNYADAIMYGEQALKLDPLADWTRRELIQNYSDIGESSGCAPGGR